MFLEFLIVRQVCFRDDTPYDSFLENNGGIDQPVFRPERNADDGQDIQVCRVVDQLDQRCFCAIDQRLLGKQVEAGVGCDGQFGEGDYLYAFFRCLSHQIFYFVYIIKTIRNLYMRHSGGNFYKSVVHIRLYLSY